MKFPPASDIRKVRKGLDVTQAQLAAASGISQSTIAKIERSTISASYATIVRLFETLDEMRNTTSKHLTAVDVASKGVVIVQCTEKVRVASDLMKTTGYSQLPVFRGDVPVGSISERSIFELVRQGKTMDELVEMSIARVMEESFPVVTENTPMTAITSMMSNCNAVLVAKKGKVVGVITNADMLKMI
ncbi:MAG: CBS domain-containing protein [Methanomassiliicoccaceae archaeon]|jgi:predicted transcriptional regulator|nr:CBS domain-containing protein [Methanomassiliicoccaceae archaeon]